MFGYHYYLKQIG